MSANIRSTFIKVLSSLDDESVESLLKTGKNDARNILSCLPWSRAERFYRRLAVSDLESALSLRFALFMEDGLVDFPFFSCGLTLPDEMRFHDGEISPAFLRKHFPKTGSRNDFDWRSKGMKGFSEALILKGEQELAPGVPEMQIKESWRQFAFEILQSLLSDVTKSQSIKEVPKNADDVLPNLYVALRRATIVKGVCGGLPEAYRQKLASLADARDLQTKISGESPLPGKRHTGL